MDIKMFSWNAEYPKAKNDVVRLNAEYPKTNEGVQVSLLWLWLP